MRHRLSTLIVPLTFVLAGGLTFAANEPAPHWAYGFTAAPTPEELAAPAGRGGAPAGRGGAPAAQTPEDTTQRKVPGSNLTFTSAQIRNAFGPADWFPEDHPTMPDVVARGRQSDVRACGLCHYPNGKGRPENSGVSGLPREYIVQALADFRNDLRKSADPRKANTNIMITIAKGLTDDEIKQAADYFSSMKWTPWVKVIESDTVPKTRIAGGLFLKLDGNETEPIAGRIIEVAENTERTELLRDPRSGFVAYVPTGSIKKGESLVMTGAGKTTACGVCHGADLKGLGPVPGLAGRSASYTVRQMYDIQQGTRKGSWSALMKPVVEKLTPDDMVAIAAYTASRVP
jgi:cytochrome c553